MKPSLNTIYLYADGHAVLTYNKHDKDAGQIQFAHLHEKLGPRCLFKGRIVFHTSGYMHILKIARAVNAIKPSLEHGSERTQQLNIEVGNIDFIFGEGAEQNHFHIPLLPDILSNGIRYQPDVEEFWDQVDCSVVWADHHIAKKFRVERKPSE